MMLVPRFGDHPLFGSLSGYIQRVLLLEGDSAFVEDKVDRFSDIAAL